jgi:hypothetical protein
VIVTTSASPMSGQSSKTPGGAGSTHSPSVQHPKPDNRNVLEPPSTTATGRAPAGGDVDVDVGRRGGR